MRDLTVVWVDLRRRSSGESPVPAAAAGLRLERLPTSAGIQAFVGERTCPVLCFEFDEPDRVGLQSLTDVKARCPAVPILMLTESHSETLAVWALRARVWDYLVAPVDAAALRERLSALAAVAAMPPRPRVNVYPVPSLPRELSVRTRRSADVTRMAFDYLQSHYDEPLSAGRMALLCHLSTSEFCRVFKRRYGMPFGEALLRCRIAAARDRLRSAQVAISDVAFAVGFNDPSYFSRVFRRYCAMSASAYRLQALSRPSLPADAFESLGGTAREEPTDVPGLVT